MTRKLLASFCGHSVLTVLIERQMKGRYKGGRSRRMQRLHMLAKDVYMALKREAEHR